ncbi:bactofilin family protein [Curvivirga sp.]|uniref:bactofilin family protein n=1 Tax=Curvivirga sp. TaxID=2856848 RepID=UPI003B5A4861
MSTKDKQPSANVTYEKSSFTPSKVLTVLSEGMVLTGNVASKGDMHVDGDVTGDIHSYRLTIGEKATVNGSLFGDEIIVSGHVKGEITGRVVRLTSTADVTGDINHDSLSIEAGAHLQGLCKRGNPITYSVNGKAVIEAAISNSTLELD